MNRWTRDQIIRMLRRLHREGCELAHNSMCRQNQALVSACNYHFKSYRRAILMAGLDYEEIRKKPYWTRQRIVKVLKAARREGLDLSWRAVSKRRDELGLAAMAAVHPHCFGHWPEALSAAGFDPDRLARYRRWTREQVVLTLRQRRNGGQPVNSKSIQDDIPGLYRAAGRHFGSFDQALRAARINPDVVRQRRDWTSAGVLTALQAFARRHRGIKNRVLRQQDSGLLRAAVLHFGSYHAAVEKAGLNGAKTR